MNDKLMMKAMGANGIVGEVLALIGNAEMDHESIVRVSGLKKGQVTRALKELVKAGTVYQNDDTGNYGLTRGPTRDALVQAVKLFHMNMRIGEVLDHGLEE